MSGLPKKVREIGEEADRQLRALDAAKQQPVTEGSLTEGNAVVNTEISSVADMPIPGLVTPEGTPPDTGAVQPAAGAGYELDWKAESERLKQSLSVLQGKYNAEIAPLNEQVRQLTSQVQQLNSGGGTPAVTGAPPGAGDTGLPSEQLEEVREQYGDSMVDLLKSVAGYARNSAIAAMKPQLDNLAKSSDDDKYIAMNKRLVAIHPDWVELNETATWFAFLDEVDEATGQQRRETIEGQYHQFNEKPFALAMSKFKARTGSTLETQVVPTNSARTIPDEGGPDRNQYRKNAVDAFYHAAPHQLKSGKMSQEQYDHLDKIYTVADIEGRVI